MVGRAMSDEEKRAVDDMSRNIVQQVSISPVSRMSEPLLSV